MKISITRKTTFERSLSLKDFNVYLRSDHGKWRFNVTMTREELEDLIEEPYFQPIRQEDIEALTCYGKDFFNECIDSCPGWLKCMEITTADQVSKAFNLNGNRATISGSMTGRQVVALIRKALKNMDQCEESV